MYKIPSRFLANAEKCTLAKREGKCMDGLRSMIEIYRFQEFKPQPSMNTPIRSGINRFGKGLRLVIETLTGTLVR